MKKIVTLVSFIVIACVMPSMSAERLDGVAAVVGDSAILLSELNAYIVMRNGGTAPDSSTLPVLKKQYISELIDGKVLIVHAAKDSTIIVTNEDVEQALTNHIQQILSQNNITLDVLEKEMREKYGIGLAKFKSQLRTQFREQIIKQKVQQQYVSQVQVSRKEVEAFYNQYKDSLPTLGESVLLSQIKVTLKPTDTVRQAAFAKITALKHRLDNGEDFAAIAKQYSEDPSAENGGDLGFIKKGTLNELRFEEIAFALNVGQISEVFESRLGFHIVTVVAKKDQMVHVRQIFVAVALPKVTTDRMMAQLDSVKAKALSSADFVAAVAKFSNDNLTKSKDGRIGWVPLLSLPEQIRSTIDSATAGTISKPIRDGNDFLLFRVDDRVQNRSLSLADDYDILAEKTREITAQKKLLDLVKKWRKEIYVDIRL